MRAVALTLIVAALALPGCGDTTSTTTPSSAPSAHTSSASHQAPTPATRSAKASSERAGLTVAAFARGYAAYLDRGAGPEQVPDGTLAVRSALGPQVPQAAPAGALTVETVSPQPARHGSYLITFADRHHRFLSSATVARSGGRVLVVAVVPPDLDTVLSRSPTPPPAAPGTAAPLVAVRGFLAGYLRWLYGHGALAEVHNLTPALRSHLRAAPALPTPAMGRLHPRLLTLAVARQPPGWAAKALVADGADTYELVLTLTREHDRWLVQSAHYPQ